MTVDIANSKHVYLSFVAAILFFVHWWYLILEVIVEPQSWIIFGIYSVIMSPLVGYQLYISEKLSEADSATFQEPSGVLFAITYVFCWLQFLCALAYFLVSMRKSPDYNIDYEGRILVLKHPGNSSDDV